MAKTSSFTRIMSVQMPRSEADRLAELARDADRSLSAEIRRAVRAHLERAASAKAVRT